MERVQHGYDRIGNRLWRRNPVDSNNAHDELYSYDGLYRLKDMQRGTLNAAKTDISPETFKQCWGLDSTGNWQSFRQNSTGSGNWDLVEGRASNPVNEITLITNSTGAGWVPPAYDKAGNMTMIPQPASAMSSYGVVYDGWNRFVKLSAGGSQVAGYQYDGLNRRSVKQSYSDGVLSSTRHYFYSSGWQVLEERVGNSTSAERQVCWGLRYVDDLVLRDRDSTGGGSLNERLYALQDPNWNATALADRTGTVQERFAYDAYGMSAVLTTSFGARVGSQYDWEVRFSGYRWDTESGLYQVRWRCYHSTLGGFLTRDPLGLEGGSPNLYSYGRTNPVNRVDPFGLVALFFDGTLQTPRQRSIIYRMYEASLDPKKEYIQSPLAWFSTEKFWKSFEEFKEQATKAAEVVVKACAEAIRKNRREQIDMIGWSRGAALAVASINELDRVFTAKRIGIPIRFVGLIDPVRTGIIGAPTRIPPRVKILWLGVRDKSRDKNDLKSDFFPIMDLKPA
jgi:RHS repeat-associated protein